MPAAKLGLIDAAAELSEGGQNFTGITVIRFDPGHNAAQPQSSSRSSLQVRLWMRMPFSSKSVLPTSRVRHV